MAYIYTYIHTYMQRYWQSLTTTGTSKDSSRHEDKARNADGLPDGWAIGTDGRNRAFYYNRKLGEVCMHVCVCACMYVCIHVQYARMVEMEHFITTQSLGRYACICMCVCVCVCMCVYVCMYASAIGTDGRNRAFYYKRKLGEVCMHVYMCGCVCMHMK